jgi:uncharacterized protein YhfF
MKQLIKNILEDVSAGQPNLESEAAREMIANLIMAGIKSGKGWFLDLGTNDREPTTAHEHNICSHGNDLLSSCSDCDEEELDTAGYPVKRIDRWLTQDIDEVKVIDGDKDDCVVCDIKTPFDKDEHLDFRMGYIEGVGQLCLNCWDKIYNDK